MGLAFRAYGDWDSAIPTLERAFEIYEYASDGTASGTVACYLGEMLRFRQELDAARMWLDRALERDIEIRDRQRALALLASTHAAQDEYTLANEALGAALDLSPLPSADVFYWSYFTLLVQGRIDDARASAALGLETAQEAGDDANSAMLARSLCQVELERLNLNQAERLARVVQRYSSPSDTISMIRGMVCDCFVGGIRGRWDSVEQTCQQWEAVARHAGGFQLAVARMMHAEALSALGKHEAALDFAEESVPLLGNNRDLGSLHLARLYLRAGAPEKARPLVERVAPRVTSKERFAAARVLLADLVELVGDEGLVKDIYSALASEQRRVVAVYTPLSVTRARARLAAHQKLWLECFRLFETAIAELERAAASWEHALALGDYAAARWRRRAKGDARRAEALEAQALALFPDSTLLLARQYSANYDPQAVLGLSPREREVLHLLTQGRRNSEIAEVLTVSTHTVDRHLENMFLKLGVRNRTEAVLKAAAVGVVFESGTVSL
jgi:ATP/maltotriose-dependent transcriptional regulator MalT